MKTNIKRSIVYYFRRHERSYGLARLRNFCAICKSAVHGCKENVVFYRREGCANSIKLYGHHIPRVISSKHTDKKHDKYQHLVTY